MKKPRDPKKKELRKNYVIPDRKDIQSSPLEAFQVAMDPDVHAIPEALESQLKKDSLKGDKFQRDDSIHHLVQNKQTHPPNDQNSQDLISGQTQSSIGWKKKIYKLPQDKTEQ